MRFLRLPWILAFAAILAALGFGAYYLHDWSAEQRWNAYRSAAEARGVRFTLAELRPPIPPAIDCSNLPIFRELREQGSQAPRPKSLERLPYSLGKGKRQPDLGPRPPDWKKVRQHFIDQGTPIDPLEPDDLRAVAAAVDSFDPLLNELIQGATPKGSWPELWHPDPNFPTMFCAQKCFRLLEFKTWSELAFGNSAAAEAAWNAQFNLAQSLDRAPTLLASLVQMSGHTTAQFALSYGLQTGTWTDEALRRIALRFLDTNLIERFRWALTTERVFIHEGIERNRHDRAKYLDSLRTEVSKWQHSVLEVETSWRSWWRDNEIWIQNFFDEQINEFDSAAEVWRPAKTRAHDPTKLTPAESKVGLMLAHGTCAYMESFANKAALTHALNKMAALACALELHRRTYGKYPETLDPLAPQFLPSLPVDPYGGQPFRYKLQPDGTYLLYSIGPNLADDAGNSGEHGELGLGPDQRFWSPRPNR